MKTTSMAGSTFTARSMSTASCIDAASDRWGENVSTAHWMIFGALRRSNSLLSSASSSSCSCGTGSAGGSTRKLMVGSDPRALAVADLARERAGLAVVDVVVRRLVGLGEHVERLDLGPDALGAAGAVEPLAERLARLPLG